ncbi:MAG: DUF559 domain-containing protein, partial [bacterium]|nr:DUF559 domain-containing protein [bacterium]
SADPSRFWRSCRARSPASREEAVLDFFCPAAKVAIELDGEWHEETPEGAGG